MSGYKHPPYSTMIRKTILCAEHHRSLPSHSSP